MNLDDPVCLCFHVSRRKIIRFIKVERPSRASQLSECFGAGTGCGWCRSYLERLMEQHSGDDPDPANTSSALDDMDLQQYQTRRQAYRDAKKTEAKE